MKVLFKYILCISLLVGFLASCSDDEVSIIPADIMNVTASSDPGTITIHWEVADDSLSIRYIKVEYYDFLLKKNVMRTASVYSDSMLIPDTRQKYGEYTFTVQPVSYTGNGGTIHEVKIVSEPAATSYIVTQLSLTADSLSTNAQEPRSGPIANLVDGDLSNFFHSAWSVDIPGPHWFQVNLGEEIADHYKFFYGNRSNAANKPVDFDLMGSTDGENWFLLRNFTKDADGLNVASGGTWTSEVYKVDKPFSYIRFIVNRTNNNTVFFTMSEFRFYDVVEIDPEASDVD